MDEPLSDSSVMGLTFEDRLPLVWTPLGSPLEAAQLAKVQLANQETLYLISSLEEHPSERIEQGNHPQEVGRLDFKINLLLDLVGQLLVRQMTLPEPVLVRLTPTEIQWEAQIAPAVGSLVQIETYLNLKYPKPITFIGRVSSIRPLSASFSIAVSLEGLSESLQQAIESLIFRHHRRLVAYSRRTTAHQDGS
jgi:hypothetical protein